MSICKQQLIQYASTCTITASLRTEWRKTVYSPGNILQCKVITEPPGKVKTLCPHGELPLCLFSACHLRLFRKWCNRSQLPIHHWQHHRRVRRPAVTVFITASLHQNTNAHTIISAPSLWEFFLGWSENNNIILQCWIDNWIIFGELNGYQI